MENRFSEWIKDPSSLEGVAADKLVQSLERYPFFATPRMLLAKHRELKGDPAFQDSVHRAAVYCRSRSRFRDWLEGEGVVTQGNTELELQDIGPVGPIVQESPEAAAVAMDKVLESGQGDQSPFPPETSARESGQAVGEPSESVDETIEKRTQFVDDGSTRSFGAWLASISDKSVEEAPEAEAGDNKTVNSEAAVKESLLGGAASKPLADHDSQAVPRPVAPAEDMGVLSGLIIKQRQKAQELREAAASPVNKPPAKTNASNGPQTETYASILAAQGKFDRARAIYEVLSLKNPDKSSYFAGLIDDLDKRSGDGE